MGKIYVVESGSDACGKATQSTLLYEYLRRKNAKVMRVSFPNYKSPSSTMVQMYLRGDFGSKPEDVDPYITSTFFAMDRYVTFKRELEPYYREGYTIIADRYTTSNMVYQAGKYRDDTERDAFLQWLYEYEFGLYGLPQPDGVFFLDLPFAISYRLMQERKKAGHACSRPTVDIHEEDRGYLEKVYANARYVARRYGWSMIDCARGDTIKSVEEIHALLLGQLSLLEG